MKKFLAILLSVTFLLSIPVFADGADLERVIKQVRSVIEIPDEMTEFNSMMYEDESGKTFWNLAWQDPIAYGNVSITADNEGNIYNYYIWQNTNDPEKKLPKINSEQALDVANNFLKTIAKDKFAKVKLVPQTARKLQESYDFSFERYENNVSVPSDTIGVSVDGFTGKVRSLSIIWTDNVEFPSLEGVLSQEAAAKAFKIAVPLELRYVSDYNYKTKVTKTNLIYTPIAGANAAIDAKTGKLIEDKSIGFMYDEMAKKESSSYMSGGGSYQLNDQEKAEASKLEGIMTAQKAEEIARSMPEIGLNKEYVLSSSYLSKDANDEYAYNLYFIKDPTEKEKQDIAKEFKIDKDKLDVVIASGEFSFNSNISLDAKTGELRSLYVNNRWGYQNDGAKLDDKTNAKAVSAAKAFMEKYKKEKLASCELATNKDELYYNDTVNVVFNRYLNKVLFENNQLSVSYNIKTGKIVSFNENWSKSDNAPSPDKAVAMDKAEDILMKDNGIELRYMKMPVGGKLGSYNMKAVYAFNKYDVIVDAIEGKLNQATQQVKEYTDIDGHWAKEQINSLADFGIVTDGNEFKPDKAISQFEYLQLLYLAVNPQYSIYSTVTQDDVYNYMISTKIITKEEKMPEQAVKREIAVKYLLSLMGYSKGAEIKGIFKVEFADAAEIDPQLVGYAAMAKGLGIVSGASGNFNPKKELTKAEAATLIYNFLSK